ncbi:unnamed protein product [Rotaria sordida]|uniref:Uncharacterized protein n=1 Tax=Rotaria sordida TaxID=392033 RepID=A0A819MGJ6_9BILA|nr:unnamed protein product [Rotaria sordida]
MKSYTVITSLVFGLTMVFHGLSIALVSGEPERCCAPKQFSSQVSTTTGMLLPSGDKYASYAYYNFSYDYDRAMIGMRGISLTFPEKRKSNLWIIENMNEGLIYTIDQDIQVCNKSPMPMKPIHCIPDDATYIHSFTYGYNDKQIIGDTWLVEIDGSANYITFSRDGLCVPLTGNLFLSNPSGVNSLTTTDFVPRIDDPSVFDIPDICRRAVIV